MSKKGDIVVERLVRWLSPMLGVVLFVGPVRAGGPILFSNHSPIVWEANLPIQYKIDRGNLGRFDPAISRGLVKAALRAWSDVPTATLEFQPDGLLDEDIKELIDFQVVWDDDNAGNVVVFDNKGDIIAAILGEENRGQVLGGAEPLHDDNKIRRFRCLLNGHLATHPNDFKSTLVHEFGHALNMDHSQINVSSSHNGDSNDDDRIPTMYPTSSDNPRALATLNPDDLAWVSRMYPAADFPAKYGTIKGTIARPDNQPVLGANVVAVKVVDGAKSDIHRFSCVSDWLKNNDGSFEIPVTPGEYVLEINPIRPSFFGRSSVGPHAENPSSPSFVNPIDRKEFIAVHTVMAGNTIDVGTLNSNN